MTAKKIMSYVLEWNPKTHSGEVQLKLEGGTFELLHIETAQEFAAVAILLDKPRVFYHPNGKIASDQIIKPFH